MAVPTTRERELRREVQALRMVAVTLVVGFHLWPATVPGGFVGVDVFFVISGFLITGMLLREHSQRGRVSLLGFWARRARRLLPAALLVVLACVVATVALVPVTHWNGFLADMRASVLYVQNWHLAADAVDYFASDDIVSPVEHFWTLSVEEQFYLVWPLLLLAAIWLGERIGRGAVVGVVGFVTAASLAYGIHATATSSALAYFGTGARAWEFGAGALVALLPSAQGIPERVRWTLSWAGLLAIVAAAALYDAGTAFPGTAALLPVAGTIAVILGGMPRGRASPARLFRLAPVQELGRLSYSIYLWHWPLLVLAPFALGGPIGGGTTVAVLAATLAASALTLHLVEQPIRDGPWLRGRRPRLTYAVAAPAMALLVAVTVVGGERVDARVAADVATSARTLAAPPVCFGAPARDPRSACAGRRPVADVVPTPLAAQREPNAPCAIVDRSGRHVHVCAFGARAGVARSTIALVGDSHATSWRAALAPVARVRRWRGLSLTRSGCAFNAATRDVDEPARSRCRRWNREVVQWFARHPEVETVFVVARTALKIRDARDHARAARRGYADAWDALPATVRRIVVLRDQPRLRGDTLDCVAAAMEDGEDPGATCAVPREFALQPDPQVAAARDRGGRLVTIDLTEIFCDADECFPVIGGALAYKDETHLTAAFGATLAPRLDRAITERLGPPDPDLRPPGPEEQPEAGRRAEVGPPPA